MFGKASKKYSNIPTWILFVILVCVLLCLYWLIFAPIVSRFFISENCIYHGPKYYQDETYLTFENGKDFQNVLSNFSALPHGEITDFYYVDNYVEDNPFYGKMCDIYALDVRLSHDEYQSEKSAVTRIAAEYQTIDDFVSYALPYDPTSGEKIIVVSFCDHAYIVRYAMITEFDTTEGFYQVFFRHSDLNWKVSEISKDN